MAALPQNSGCGPLPFPAHLIVSIFVDFIGYWWQLIIHIHNTHYTLTNAVAAVYMTDSMGFKILWLAASTQSHANDWLRLHSKWLAAPATRLSMQRGLCVCCTQVWAVQKRLNRSRCCLGCGLGWAQWTMHWVGGPDPPREGTIFIVGVVPPSKMHCNSKCVENPQGTESVWPQQTSPRH